MYKVKWAIIVVLVFAITSSWKPAEKQKINWISVKELNELYAREPRPILFDVYTDWCGWCKEMDRTTYKNPRLVNYINSKYYAVRYDAESREPVTYNGKIYQYNNRMQTNDFAVYLLFGRLEYPSTVFLSSPDARPAPLSGYMKPKQMEGPLKFFGEKADAHTTFIEFDKKLKKEW